MTWLASAAQLRCEPDEVEYRCAVPALLEWGHGLLHVFAFRVNKPHWVAERDWVVAVVGPFDPSAELTPAAVDGFAVHSLYEPEGSMSHEDARRGDHQVVCAGREDPTS